MRLLKSLLFISLVCSSLTSFAAEEHKVASTIHQVTVYLSQARIERKATVEVKKGNNQIILNNLTPTLQPKSIQAKTSDGILLSISQQQNFINNLEVSNEIETFEDSILLNEHNLKFVKNAIEVNIIQQKLITNNNPLPSNTEDGFTKDELHELVMYFESKMLPLKDELVILKEKEQKITTQVNKYRNQITELTGFKTHNTKEVILNIASAKTQTIEIEFSYITNAASWRPSYNMNASGSNENIQLSYIGHVSQNTGVDWTGVNLILSSANPSISQNRPILQPWLVSYYQPYVNNGYNISQNTVTNLAYEKKDKNIYAEEISANDDYADVLTPASMATSDLSIEYTIAYAADIKSNNKESDIWIKDEDIPAEYQYHAVPKLSSSGYLLAKIANWNRYNLLVGTTNLFYDGMYIGETIINPLIQSDTLLLSMGRDARIVVSRSKEIEGCFSKIFSKQKKQTFTYELSVTNNKSKTIDIELLDHFPVSQYEDIKVELLEDSGAESIASSGKLVWDVQLKPNESKKFKFSFTVSYPKDLKISGL